MLNIKNQETEAAVRKLADQLGTSLTEAITIAVRCKLQQLEIDRGDYLQRIQKSAAQVQKVSAPSAWLTESDLYDQTGLPQ